MSGRGYGRIVENGMVTRWGPTYIAYYPEDAVVEVTLLEDDPPSPPLRAWTRTPEREAELA